MKKTTRLVEISPEEAARYLKFNDFRGQRRLQDRHVESLAEKMMDGRFHVGNVALVHRDKTTRMADGQHQCSASVLSGMSFQAVLQEFHLNGEDDESAVANIFSQYNVDRPRNRGDIAWIYATEMQWGHWPRKLVQHLASALTVISHPDGYSDALVLSKDESARLLAANRKVCEWVASTEAAFHRHMIRVPVIAAMILTWQKHPEKASEFWLAVRDGDELDKSHPAFVLREFLKDVSLQSGTKNKAGRAVTSRRAAFVKCIHAWNAWRAGKVTVLKYHAAADIPKVM